jgi:osmoprotectant transport system substrate-binding protein/osmoprotectant transport system permease protein
VKPLPFVAAAMAIGLAAASAAARARHEVVVGSKKFTESVILGEITTRLLAASAVPATHRAELGGSRVLWDALLHGDIDMYAEYSGTLRLEILRGKGDVTDLAARLLDDGVVLGPAFGFEDTYALGIPRELAARLGIDRISQLPAYPDLRYGFSHEFLDRVDGWPAVRSTYGISSAHVTGLDHDLAYRAVAAGAIDVTDLYSTDAEIRARDLTVIHDDRRSFPEYEAVLLLRADLLTSEPRAREALGALEGRISAEDMVAMNAEAKLDKMPPGAIADRFLRKLGVDPSRSSPPELSLASRLGQRTLEHLFLVLSSLASAIVVGIPLGIVAASWRGVGRLLLAIVGIVQTVPSLALLVLMIPLLGIGTATACAALFLYSLLPIVQNTHAGLTGIPADLCDSALALGLPPTTRMRWIDLPLASGAILAGIKTSAVIGVGTATLGALVGAGGYGQPILAGIRLDDTPLILEGALPAALMALAVQWAFDWFERIRADRNVECHVE